MGGLLGYQAKGRPVDAIYRGYQASLIMRRRVSRWLWSRLEVHSSKHIRVIQSFNMAIDKGKQVGFSRGHSRDVDSRQRGPSYWSTISRFLPTLVRIEPQATAKFHLCLHTCTYLATHEISNIHLSTPCWRWRPSQRCCLAAANAVSSSDRDDAPHQPVQPAPMPRPRIILEPEPGTTPVLADTSRRRRSIPEQSWRGHSLSCRSTRII